MLLIVTGGSETAIRCKWAKTGEMSIKLRGEETGTAHFTVGRDVDSRFLLVTQS